MTLVLILILVPEPLTSSRSCKIHQSHINALSSISLIFLDRFTFKFTYMHTHALASESVASIESPFILSKKIRNFRSRGSEFVNDQGVKFILPSESDKAPVMLDD